MWYNATVRFNSTGKLVESYIDKRIQQARTADADSIAFFDANRVYYDVGKRRAILACDKAQGGHVAKTASHLLHDNTLSISQKGNILARAYLSSADRIAHVAGRTSNSYFNSDLPGRKEKYQKEAQQSLKIAQGLTRTAQRARKA